MRGNAMASPGVFHSPVIHNFIEHKHPDSFRVTTEDALKFKHYMGTDKAMFNKSMPGYPMFYDTDFDYRKDRVFWFRFLVGALLLNYGIARAKLEYDRVRMRDRIDGFPNQPAHHFNNRGGVLVHKQFQGFEKYHESFGSYTRWFSEAYNTKID